MAGLRRYAIGVLDGNPDFATALQKKLLKQDYGSGATGEEIVGYINRLPKTGPIATNHGWGGL